MKNNQAEILTKVAEIVKLKKELIQLIVPEKTYKHFEVIGNEVKALIIESICQTEEDNKDQPKSANESKVKKVTID
jgi:hypothetical protein